LVEVAVLLWGTVVHRPYVYAFFACFLAFALHHLGGRRTALFGVVTWAIAFASEWSSTRNGFPFGYYRYFDETRTRELWISNVPFWDSLSFVFLSYFSFALAAAILSAPWDRARGVLTGERHPGAPIVGGVLMMLLDVVIDPVALQGEKWFLGRIYDYPHRGFYFGVTAANFAGWFFVGTASQWAFQLLSRSRAARSAPPRPVTSAFPWGVLAVYAGVLVFNLAITMAIGDWPLAAAGLAVSGATLALVAPRLRAPRPGRVLVCAATATEAAACEAGIADAAVDGLEVLRTGVGPERAAGALRARLRAGPAPALVVSSGFAGAEGVAVGALVTADAIARLEAGRTVAVALPSGTLRLAPGATPVLVATAGEVSAPPAGRGPCAIDMESAALAVVAAEAGLAFAVLRLVTDTPAAPLPAIARSAAAALSARAVGARARLLARAARDVLAGPREAVALVAASRGWTRLLRAGWRARAAAMVAALPAAPPAHPPDAVDREVAGS
jgi:uncharacterized membrane protein